MNLGPFSVPFYGWTVRFCAQRRRELHNIRCEKINPSKRKTIRRKSKRFTRTRIHFPRCENRTQRFAFAVYSSRRSSNFHKETFSQSLETHDTAAKCEQSVSIAREKLKLAPERERVDEMFREWAIGSDGFCRSDFNARIAIKFARLPKHRRSSFILLYVVEIPIKINDENNMHANSIFQIILFTFNFIFVCLFASCSINATKLLIFSGYIFLLRIPQLASGAHWPARGFPQTWCAER